MEFIEENEVKEKPRPWIRFFARQIDYFIWSIFLMIYLLTFPLEAWADHIEEVV